MNIVLILFECVLECRYHIYKPINPFPVIFFLRKMLSAFMSATCIQMHPDWFYHGSKHYEP